MPDIKQQVQAAVQLPDNNPEGQMAKADLYRAAKMSIKLFQMIQDGQDLEEWVQAKITKSADYLDSVYHYMEYQMKFGSGSTSVASVDDITAELDTLTPPEEERAEEDDEELTDMEESMNYEQKLKALLEGAMIKQGIKEAKKAKPDFLDVDKDGNKKEPMKKAIKDKKVKEAKHDEPAEPDADLIAKKKAREAAQRRREEKAEADKDDLSKDYKPKAAAKSNTTKVAGKAYGGAKQKDVAEGKKAKPDFLDLDKDGDKKEPSKRAAKEKTAVKESADLDVILKLAGRKPLNG